MDFIFGDKFSAFIGRQEVFEQGAFIAVGWQEGEILKQRHFELDLSTPYYTHTLTVACPHFEITRFKKTLN